ncbi:hypothetical protein GCM10009612_09230 [Streptomyces beijiangensis]
MEGTAASVPVENRAVARMDSREWSSPQWPRNASALPAQESGDEVRGALCPDCAKSSPSTGGPHILRPMQLRAAVSAGRAEGPVRSDAAARSHFPGQARIAKPATRSSSSRVAPSRACCDMPWNTAAM